METETNVVVSSAIVMPAVTAKEAIEAWKAYLDLKKAIAEPDDVQKIQGKDFLKKSYWRKVATFFNLSVTIVSERREELQDGDFVYHFICEAKAPNGRVAGGTGSCSAMEKQRMNTIHNVRSTAETRAWNRAVSNLVGGGEVSADEVVDDDDRPHMGYVNKPSPRPAVTMNKLGKCVYCGTLGKWHKKGCPNWTEPAGTVDTKQNVDNNTPVSLDDVLGSNEPSFDKQ
jgi:hypothetical protein